MQKYQDIIRLANVHRLMITRCENPRAQNYHRYGARGISVCNEWHDQDAFISWGLDNGYREGLELGRIDVNGNYCPDNCRWITHKENMNNTTVNRHVTAWGETKTLDEWEDDPRSAVSGRTISARIDRYGWSPERSIETSAYGTPRKDKGVGRKSISAWGESKTLLDWSLDARCAVSYDVLKSRFIRGGYEPEIMIAHKGRLDVTRPKRRTTRVTAFGEVKSVSDWSEDDRCIVTRTCLKQRLERGWLPERAMTTPNRR